MQQSGIASDNLYHTDLQQAAYTTTYATHNLFTTPSIQYVSYPNEVISASHRTMSDEATLSTPHPTMSTPSYASPVYMKHYLNITFKHYTLSNAQAIDHRPQLD